MAKIKTQGTTLHISNEDANATAYASATFAQVKGIRSIPAPDGETSEITTTDLDSEAEEYVPGLPNFGKFSPSGDAIDGDAGQAAVQDAYTAQETRWFRITDSAGGIAYFKGIILRFNNIGAEPNAVKPLSFVVRISGAISYV